MPTETATYNLVGGWVQIAYGPGIVELVGAAPNSGFSIEIKESGPDRVEVEFESDDHESKFRADETAAAPPRSGSKRTTDLAGLGLVEVLRRSAAPNSLSLVPVRPP